MEHFACLADGLLAFWGFQDLKGFWGTKIQPLTQDLANELGLDYAEYGGAPLLGVDGGFIICHGSSKAKAIKNAVRVARDIVAQQVISHIRENIAKEEFVTNGNE